MYRRPGGSGKWARREARGYPASAPRRLPRAPGAAPGVPPGVPRGSPGRVEVEPAVLAGEVARASSPGGRGCARPGGGTATTTRRRSEGSATGRAGPAPVAGGGSEPLTPARCHVRRGLRHFFAARPPTRGPRPGRRRCSRSSTASDLEVERPRRASGALASATSRDARAAAGERLDRGDAVIPDAARHDEPEGVEVDREVEREAVHRDPAREAHADGAELGELARPRARRPTRAGARAVDPDADHARRRRRPRRGARAR